MTRRLTVFPVDEIRGRLLHEALLAEATAAVRDHDWSGAPIEVPDFPEHSTTPTGTLRAVVVAS